MWISLEKKQFKMLVVLSPIFVEDTKIIFRYHFAAPLNVYPFPTVVISMWTIIDTFIEAQSLKSIISN